jgi:deferrochelatase/peroxidase EfeB
MVGRWRDGTPLVLSPEKPMPGESRSREWVNDFGYKARDPHGERCPLGAHIRRANPRDSLQKPLMTNRHRIIRRGVPYEGGLMFVCYQADIARQFEFVQSQWLGEGNAFGLGRDADFTTPGARGKLVLQRGPAAIVPLEAFVTLRGGGYFFAPGLTALRQIAGCGD